MSDERKLIPISITHAHLSSMRIDFNDEKKCLAVYATLDLLSSDGEKVTEVMFSSDSWQDKKKIEVSPHLIFPAGEMRTLLETTCIRKINARHQELLAPKYDDVIDVK